jgi:hypothetical protein
VNPSQVSASQASSKFKTPADVHKKRIFEVVNNMSEAELEKVSELLKKDQVMDREDITSEDLERAAEL